MYRGATVTFALAWVLAIGNAAAATYFIFDYEDALGNKLFYVYVALNYIGVIICAIFWHRDRKRSKQ